MSESTSNDFSAHFNLPASLIRIDALTNVYYNYEKLESMANWLKKELNDKANPLVAIICGSGLGGIADRVINPRVIAYQDIPDFPRSTVEGHKGNLIFGFMDGIDVVCMQGRFHPYEGYSMALCTMPIRLFKLLGVKAVILTNAAGGINTTYNVGDYMLLKDHFSLPLLSLQHPLVGPNDKRFGARFIPINNLYTKSLRNLFLQVSQEYDIKVHEGVYATIGGPTYETVSDSLFLQKNGVDCVGMSTAHEAVVAAHCGLKVLSFSVITDKVVLEFDVEETTDHEEICKVAALKAKDAEFLISKFLEQLSANLFLLDA